METMVDYDSIYKADRNKYGAKVVVIEAGNERPLTHVIRHSPDGFEWGYGGSGPADLALSILVDAVGPDLADEHYQDFKWVFIAFQPPGGFEIRLSEILKFVRGGECCGTGDSAEQVRNLRSASKGQFLQET